MSESFIFQRPFLFQVLARLVSETKILLRSLCVHSPDHAFSFFPREVLFASSFSGYQIQPSFRVELTPSTPCTPSALLFLTKVRFSLILTLFHLTIIWIDGSVPIPYEKRGSGVLTNCSLCGAEAAFFYLATNVLKIFC